MSSFRKKKKVLRVDPGPHDFTLEKRKKYMDDYLGQYKGSYDDELLLWKLAGFSENTFNYH